LPSYYLVLGVLVAVAAGTSALGVAFLVNANRIAADSSAGRTVRAVLSGAVGLLLLVGGVGSLGVVLLPALLRGHQHGPSNESVLIGDTRTVIAAETAYASTNGEQYDVLECLVAPTRCRPRYEGPTFLDATLLRTEKSGYRRTFHPGPRVEPADRKAGMSPTSLRSFAYVAVPIVPGRTGVRGFCGDDTGVICFTIDGTAPRVVAGRCAQPCTVVP